MSYKAYKRGVQYEQLFMELTGATERKVDQSDRDHIDCNLGSLTVDVKGLKKKHKEGYVLVEFKNVAGEAGWCHPDSGADLLAFMFEEGFYVVPMMDLFSKATELVKAHGDYTKVLRKNYVKAKDGLYKLIGRTKWKGRVRKDVFTYITKDDLLSLTPDFYPIE